MKDFKNTSLILRRADITKNFTIIPNYIPQSKSLSSDAIYLLVLVLSKPSDWYYVKTQFWRDTVDVGEEHQDVLVVHGLSSFVSLANRL